MDVTTAEEARIAEEAGAVAVMALERVPADIRKDGGVARMSDATVIKAIKEAVTIPVMAKARIGHFVEAQILEALETDYIDESEVGTAAVLAADLSLDSMVIPDYCLNTLLMHAWLLQFWATMGHHNNNRTVCWNILWLAGVLAPSTSIAGQSQVIVVT